MKCEQPGRTEATLTIATDAGALYELNSSPWLLESHETARPSLRLIHAKNSVFDLPIATAQAV